MYKCPECGEKSPKADWQESEVGCEDCGSHPALICPKCGDYIDMVMNSEEDLSD